MILKYMKDDDDNYSIGAEGDTATGYVTVTVFEDGGAARHDLLPIEARELATEIVNIADRLDPPKPSLAVQLDRTLRSGIQSSGV